MRVRKQTEGCENYQQTPTCDPINQGAAVIGVSILTFQCHFLTLRLLELTSI